MDCMQWHRATRRDGDPPGVPPLLPQAGEWDDWGDWGADDEWGAQPGPSLPGRELSEAEARRKRLARWARFATPCLPPVAIGNCHRHATKLLSDGAGASGGARDLATNTCGQWWT